MSEKPLYLVSVSYHTHIRGNKVRMRYNHGPLLDIEEAFDFCKDALKERPHGAVAGSVRTSVSEST